MHARARQLIAELTLAPHPEGGFFREVFRSGVVVEPPDGRPARPAMTTILFLLPAGTHSRWHRVRSEELWHFHEGGALDLYRAPDDLSRVERVVLGPAGGGASPVHVVPAGWWQAARPRGDFSLAGCTVAPGFDFADFEFLSDDPERVARLGRAAADLASLA
jgi:hypothetical protein